MTKQEILDLLWYEPVEIGHWVGFKDLTELHNDWLKKFLYSDTDLTLQGHRGSYKTTTLSLFFALHTIIFPNETIIFFRKSGITEVILQTIKILQSGCVREIIRTLHNNKELKFFKSSSYEIDTNLRTNIKGQAQIAGGSMYGAITGRHADIVVTDDIVNVNDRISSAEREHTKTVYQELQNIKNRDGRIINTGTPWHKEDCFSLMPDPIKYDCYSTGLISPEKLRDLKDHMSSSLFAANYELKHIAAEDLLFTDPATGGESTMVMDGIMHVDSAFYGSDYTALTIAKIQDKKVYMFGTMWRKHVEDCYADIIALYKKFRCGKLYMERNADKGMVAKDLKKLEIRIVPYDESMNKYIKIATYLKALWKDIIWVEGTDMDYLEQICDYTEDAEHDDAPDSAASVARLLYPKIGKPEYIPIGIGGSK